ncbi:S-layer homology domain-containing protein [Paenibacillus sp. SC116]|uniref:S-layer homology domain-containing protein n=1 Tax=Paenibacillus sp. SC116 TaxID=2968986 RepID=UPI00215B34DA|nr:S-layer homology domain-containing protein [Paenibacillus sp. SC116]MCR8845230.1 S-layer homology domain-containing protein [Paenibacillus sp. SC116]
MKKKAFVAMTALSVFLGGSIPVSLSSAASVSTVNGTVAATFSDVAGHWAEGAIYEAVKRGYVTGYPTGKFLPNAKVSRAEFVKMAVSALNLPVESTSNGLWYVKYVDAAKTSGIFVEGDFVGSDWNKPLSREEMSKVAVRALEMKAEDKQWMYMATKNGMISGTAPGVLSPDGSTTRAQAISVIERMLSVKNGKKLAVDKYAVSAAELYWHDTNIMTMLPRYFHDSFNGKPFDNKAMVSQSPDGKATCKVTQLIAIDLGDPKDPNRKLIESKEYAWVGNGKYHKLKDSDGYAVMGISETKITGKLNVERLFPCQIAFQNDDWYEMPENVKNPKKPDRTYGIMPWNAKYEQFQSFVNVSKLSSGTVSFATGTLFPKGDFVSDKAFRFIFGGMGNWQGSYIPIYHGKLNKNYHQ